MRKRPFSKSGSIDQTNKWKHKGRKSHKQVNNNKVETKKLKWESRTTTQDTIKQEKRNWKVKGFLGICWGVFKRIPCQTQESDELSLVNASNMIEKESIVSTVTNDACLQTKTSLELRRGRLYQLRGKFLSMTLQIIVISSIGFTLGSHGNIYQRSLNEIDIYEIKSLESEL